MQRSKGAKVQGAKVQRCKGAKLTAKKIRGLTDKVTSSLLELLVAAKKKHMDKHVFVCLEIGN